MQYLSKRNLAWQRVFYCTLLQMPYVFCGHSLLELLFYGLEETEIQLTLLLDKLFGMIPLAKEVHFYSKIWVFMTKSLNDLINFLRSLSVNLCGLPI